MAQAVMQLCKTESLTIAYEHHGLAAGAPVILLHGFSYSPAPSMKSPRPSAPRATG